MNLDDRIWPTIVVSVHSPRWMATIQKSAANHEQIELDWVASLEDAYLTSLSHHGSAVIVELPKAFQPNELIDQLAKFSGAPNRALLFVMGNESHEPIRESISALGIAAIATSILEFDSLWNKAIRHIGMHEIDGLTVEELVEARFPL